MELKDKILTTSLAMQDWDVSVNETSGEVLLTHLTGERDDIRLTKKQATVFFVQYNNLKQQFKDQLTSSEIAEYLAKKYTL